MVARWWVTAVAGVSMVGVLSACGTGNDLLVTFGDGEPTARVNSSNALDQLPRVEGKNGGRYRVGDYIIQGSTERAYVTHVYKPGSALITPSEILLSSEQNS